MCAGIYIWSSLLVGDMMSIPSNTNSSGGMCRNCRGIHNVNLGDAAALLSSSSVSSLLSSIGLVYAGVSVGVGVVGSVQWLLRRTARPVLSDSLNASRVLQRRIYNRVKHTVVTNCDSVRVVRMVPA